MFLRVYCFPYTAIDTDNILLLFCYNKIFCFIALLRRRCASRAVARRPTARKGSLHSGQRGQPSTGVFNQRPARPSGTVGRSSGFSTSKPGRPALAIGADRLERDLVGCRMQRHGDQFAALDQYADIAVPVRSNFHFCAAGHQRAVPMARRGRCRRVSSGAGSGSIGFVLQGFRDFAVFVARHD